MKRVLVISDSHDNLNALRALKENPIVLKSELVIHLGDIVSPFSLKEVLDLGKPVKGVFGNNDGDRDKLKEMCPTLTGQPLTFKLMGYDVILFHGFKTVDVTKKVIYSLARDLSNSIILYGHTHEPDLNIVNGNLVLNPGALSGYLAPRRTFSILDVSVNEIKAVIMDLDKGEVVNHINLIPNNEVR